MPIKAVEPEGVDMRSDLATVLCVPVPALNSVSLASLVCQRSGCSLSVIKHNNSHCVLHSQPSCPSELTKFVQPLMKYWGYGLYGPQFLPSYCDSHPTICACSSLLCKKLGCSHHGMVRFPKDAKYSAEAARVLGMSALDW